MIHESDRLTSAVFLPKDSGDARLAQEWHVQLSSCVLFSELIHGGAVREYKGAALRDPHEHRTADIPQWDAEPEAIAGGVHHVCIRFGLFDVDPHELAHFRQSRFRVL